MLGPAWRGAGWIAPEFVVGSTRRGGRADAYGDWGRADVCGGWFSAGSMSSVDASDRVVSGVDC